MKKTKIISFMLAALLMFCMLAACNDSTSDSNVKKIGVMQFAEFDALQKAYDGFVDGLKEAGYEVDLQYASNDIPTQVSQIENMINSGCQMLVIASIDGDSLGTVLEQAKEKDIPVIAYDRLIMNSDAVTY